MLPALPKLTCFRLRSAVTLLDAEPRSRPGLLRFLCSQPRAWACAVHLEAPGETMAKENTDRSNEITDPDNPPQALLRPEARRAALWSYLGPVIALFVIVAVALVYWGNRGSAAPDERTDDAAIGTVGRESPG